jgi:outer membrane protein OmpA-like peptidoglycan-associated protein
MMRLDHNALDGFLKDAGPAPVLPWMGAPVPAGAEAVPIPLVVEDNAVPIAAAMPPAEEAQDSAEEETGGYALMVIEGAAATPSEEEMGWQEAVPGRAAEGGDVGAAPVASVVPARVPESLPAPPVEDRALHRAEQQPRLSGVEGLEGLERSEGALLPRRRRWLLMAAAGVVLAGAAGLLVRPAQHREHPAAATETATRAALVERAPMASPSQVPIPEPAPREASAAPQVAPMPQPEETMHEMRFPGGFYRNSSRPHHIDVAAFGGIVRLLRTGCAAGSIVITGHTCALGDASANQELSLQRARRVGELLVRAGFSPERLRFVSQGDRQPIADNRVIEGQRQNRRVTLSCDPNPPGHPRQPGDGPGTGSRTPTPEEEAR